MLLMRKKKKHKNPKTKANQFLISLPSESQEFSLRNWLYDEEKKKEYNNGQDRLTKPEKPLGFTLEVQED